MRKQCFKIKLRKTNEIFRYCYSYLIFFVINANLRINKRFFKLGIVLLIVSCIFSSGALRRLRSRYATAAQWSKSRKRCAKVKKKSPVCRSNKNLSSEGAIAQLGTKKRPPSCVSASPYLRSGPERPRCQSISRFVFMQLLNCSIWFCAVVELRCIEIWIALHYSMWFSFCKMEHVCGGI